MKTLLFVQTGDGRPKCVPTMRYERERLFSVPGWTPAHSDIGGDHDRWWLVECENADAGRRVIASGVWRMRDGAEAYEGRILAQGAKT